MRRRVGLRERCELAVAFFWALNDAVRDWTKSWHSYWHTYWSLAKMRVHSRRWKPSNTEAN